jgi:filamentous hemagglutinin family protein
VRFSQPGAASAILNRVTGPASSVIDGALEANGRVVLLNPNGVLIGKAANINVGGLLVSTLEMKDSDFMSGKYELRQRPDRPQSAVVNKGTIRAAPGGRVALVAPVVNNEGHISAAGGEVALAAGTKAIVNFDGTGLVSLAVSDAPPGDVVLDGQAASRVMQQAVNNKHLVEAGSITMRDGRMVLGGAEGLAINEGTASADASAGSRAGRVRVESTQATLLPAGSLLAANGSGLNSAGGDIQVLSLGTTGPRGNVVVDQGSRLEARGGASGDGGRITARASGTTRFSGRIDARGGDRAGRGGLGDLAGAGELSYQGTADLRASVGATGMLRLQYPAGVRLNSRARMDEVRPASEEAWPANGSLDVETLAAQLELGDVTVTAGGAAARRGDITLEARLAWSSASRLELNADRHVVLERGAAVTNSGGGSLALRADRRGSGSAAAHGTVMFHDAGTQVNWARSHGDVRIYYNPDLYGRPRTFASHVAMGPGRFIDYMLVNTVERLQAMSENLGGSYALGRDIDAKATAGWNGGAGFHPIGDPRHTHGAGGFTGTLDGQLHAITDLTVNRPDTDHVGLFGFADVDMIRGLRVFGADIVGRDFVGTIAGHASGAMRDVRTTGAVCGRDRVGGVVGYKSDRSIVRYKPDNSMADIHSGTSVSGRDKVGGLVGSGYNSPISDSHATGTVRGRDDVGGVVGVTHKGGRVRLAGRAGGRPWCARVARGRARQFGRIRCGFQATGWRAAPAQGQVERRASVRQAPLARTPDSHANQLDLTSGDHRERLEVIRIGRDDEVLVVCQEHEGRIDDVAAPGACQQLPQCEIDPAAQRRGATRCDRGDAGSDQERIHGDGQTLLSCVHTRILLRA